MATVVMATDVMATDVMATDVMATVVMATVVAQQRTFNVHSTAVCKLYEIVSHEHT